MSNFAQTPAATQIGGFGHSASTDAETAGRECVRQALAGRTPVAGDLVFVFPNATYDLEALHRGAAAEAGPAALVGATTCGAFTGETQVPLGAVAAHLVADEMSFGVCHVERDDHDIAGSTRRAVETARERAGEAHPHSVLVLLCDGMTPDQREVARGAYEVTSALTPLVGGAAGDDLFWRGTYTFGEDRVLPNGLLVVWINSAHPMGVAVDHGWHAHGRPDARHARGGRHHPRARRAPRDGGLHGGPRGADRRRPSVQRAAPGAPDRPADGQRPLRPATHPRGDARGGPRR